MAFSKRTSYPSKDNKYYFSSINPFYGTRYGPPAISHNCTWYAWGRFSEIRGSKASGLATGNANTWYANTKNFSKGKTPKLGAVVVYWYNKGGGHVAVVEEIKANGDIVTSNSGWSGSNFWMETCKKSKGYLPGWLSGGLHGFIYNDKISGGVSGGVTEGDHPQEWYVSKYGNEAKVYFALKAEGMSHLASCAIMGNMHQESGFRPTVVNGIGATGLCQWYKGRCTKMKNYNTGLSWKTIPHQVKFLVHELKTSYKGVYNVLIDEQKSLYDRTYKFLASFEIPTTDPAKLKKEMGLRYPYAKTYDKRYGGAGGGVEGLYGEEGAYGYAVNMQKRSEQLYHSNNYGWLYEKEKEETAEQKRLREERERLNNFYKNIKATNFTEYIDYHIEGQSMKGSAGTRKVREANSTLDVSRAMVEAPFVEIDFAGTTIGTYKNDVDDYPNHISKLEVEKVNGEINKYTFDLVHQIRAGEDPNLIDKILSKVKYSTIKIRYGDFNSNVIYSDEKAVITNVSMNRDYASSRISYTIYATSAGEFITSYKLNFPARTEKPSTVINELLYSNPQTSSLLLDTFPGMKNTTLVSSNNLIPSNDAVLRIEEKTNISTIDYVNFLVGCMSNIANGVNDIIRGSTYYISYENDFFDQFGGAFFKISEVVKDLAGENFNHIFEVTVGFPDNNYVMGFNVDNNIAWSILYENMQISDEYIYRIDDRGQKQKQYSPNLMSSSSQLNEIQKNWWTQMVNYPISATLTLKGLMKPTMLMNYVKVNVVFYGQKHITSGTYTITGQKDILSGDGFRTVLSLTRVGE